MFTVFPYVAGSHPFAARLEQFRAHIAAANPSSGGCRSSIHSEIKVVRSADGSWQLDRFYWSRQQPDEAAPGGMTSATLNYAAKTGEVSWAHFPDDCYLIHMDGYFRSNSTRARVLRYVPLRRATFVTQDAGKGSRIGKFKRRSRFEEAYQLLGLVHDAVSHADVGFRVAAPLGIDPEQCLYFQTALLGENVADLIANSNAASFIGNAGSIHAEIGKLQPRHLKFRNNRHWLAGANEDLALIKLYLPQAAARLAPVVERLARSCPEDCASDFCHGDFVCSQLLRSGQDWSVTDFDLCHAGDRYRDMAMFLASLPYDVALFSHVSEDDRLQTLLQRCEDAYLADYCRVRREHVDQARLGWHRTCAELYFMALGLKKDRHRDSDFARRQRIVLQLADEGAGL